jgi:hypothetical protein
VTDPSSEPGDYLRPLDPSAGYIWVLTHTSQYSWGVDDHGTIV